MRGLLSRWSARTGVVAMAIFLTLALGLTIASATLDGGSGETTATQDPSTTSATDSSPSPTTGSAGTESSSSNGGGGTVNNEVVVRNTVDNRTTHREGFGIARVTGGDVLNTNSAAAVGACSDCRTVAISTQIVLVMGDSDVIAPRNQAVALNVGCLRCHTYALAYQYVVSTDGIVRFTSEAQQRLAELQSQIRALGASDLPYLELEAQVDALVEQMWALVDEEIVAVGGRPEGSAYEDSDAAEGTDSSPSPSPTESSMPDPSASPEVTPTEPSDASTTPTPASEEASPSPTPTASSETTEPSPSPSSDPSP